MDRKVKAKVRGFRTKDGAGVSLVRVLGRETVETFDPILMLDSFDSINPEEYTAGFPMHPHRGIETISYLYKGNMVHKDSLGNEEAISDGEVQWMNSGAGIVHEEQVPAANRLLGVQLWLNLPKAEKMSLPSYHSIQKKDIPEIEMENGMLRLLAGNYKEYCGYQGEHLPLDYYDIHLNENAKISLETEVEASVMLFTLVGDIWLGDEFIEEKTAVKLTQGNRVEIKNGDKKAQVLFISSRALKEPVSWAGPIVMNTQEEVLQAFEDLRNGTFIKNTVAY